MSEPIRLSKRVVALTGCSRSQAERYIEAGQVKVDGVVVDRPEHPVGDERVEVDTDSAPAPVESVTLLLHKPAGVSVEAAGPRQGALSLIAAESQWDADPSGRRPLRRHFAQLRPLLPLDVAASGLQPFTQDGRLLQRCQEQASRIEQEFVVEVAGSLAHYGLHLLSRGLELEGRRMPPCKVSWQSETRLRFAIKGVRAGMLQAMCAGVGLEVRALRRIRIGGVPLAKLPEAQWRYLGERERF
jgi:23S rRNA pseudouridine2604 synthase